MDSEEESLNNVKVKQKERNPDSQPSDNSPGQHDEDKPLFQREHNLQANQTSDGFFREVQPISHPNIPSLRLERTVPQQINVIKASERFAKTTNNFSVGKTQTSQLSKMFSVFNTSHALHKKQSTDSFSKDSSSSKNESFESEVIDDKKVRITEDSKSDRRHREKQKKQHIFQAALEVFQIAQVTGRHTKTHESDDEPILQEDLQNQFEMALQDYDAHHKINLSEMFEVQHKNEFEMLDMYTDQWPLLRLRKYVLFALKLISYICLRIIKHKITETIVLMIILFNTVTLMMQDPTSDVQTAEQAIFEEFFLIAYTIEMCIKIVALGFVFNKGAYLRDSWNLLDFVIVGTSLLPLLLGGSKSINLSSLRSLRVLRPLRTISTIPALKIILSTLFAAVPFLLNSLIILFFYILVFAIAALQLFKGVFKQRCYEISLGIDLFNDQNIICGGYELCTPPPSGNYGNGTFVCGKMLANPDFGKTNFDTIFYSFMNIYQMVTLEGWTQIMYWMMYGVHVATCIFGLVLTFIGNNVVVNLTLAIIKAKYTDQEKKNRAILAKQQAKQQEMSQDMDQEQRMIEEELQKEEEKDEEKSSDSDEELMPSLQSMKQYSRQEREQKKDKAAEELIDKEFDAGQHVELNFVYDDMINLKQKIREEEQQREEQERQQRILDHFIDQQRKKMKIFFKKNATTPMIDPTRLQRAKLQSIVQANHNETDHIQDDNSRRTSQAVADGMANKLGRSVSRLSNSQGLAVINSRKPSIPMMELNPKKIPLKEQGRKASRQESGDLDANPSPVKLNKLNHQGSRKTIFSRREEFDIILQDLDDLPPEPAGRANQPSPKRSDAIQRRINLRGVRFKGESANNTQSIIESQQPTIVEKNDDSEILSDLEEKTPAPKSSSKMPRSGDKQRKTRMFFAEPEESEDLLNDSDFVVEERIEEKDKDRALAQVIFQQRFGQHNKKRPTPSIDFKKKQTNPKLRGFIIHGLQEHLRNMQKHKTGRETNRVADEDQHNMKMQELIMLTNDQLDHEEQQQLEENISNLKSKSKRSKIQGQPQDYKLILNLEHVYYSNSTNDIMEAKIHLREKQRLERLERQIKNKHYIMEFEPFDESKAKPQKNDKPKKKDTANPDQSINDGTILKNISLLSKEINMKESSMMKLESRSGWELSRLGTSTGIQTIIKVPLSRSSLQRKIKIQKLVRKMQQEENLDFLFGFEKSNMQNEGTGIMLASTPNNRRASMLKSSVSRKKKIMRQRIDYHNVHVVKKLIVEPCEEQIHEFEFPLEKIYLQILQMDFQSNIKSAYHWSADNVIDNFPIRRANKIRSKLSTSGQEKVIFLAGVTGWIAVRHRELNDFVKGKHLNNFILGAVVGNTVILSMNGSFQDAESLLLIDMFGSIFTYIFIGEMGLKLMAFGPIGYLRDKMNIFDGAIVSLSILELTLLSGGSGKAVSAFRSVRIFRTFRVLRVTRLLRSMAFMQVIVKVIQSTLENFIYICGLMFLFCIIYSLLGMQMYGGNFNFRNNKINGDFDSFYSAFLVIFQLLTVENWNDIITLTYRSGQNKFLSSIYLLTWIFIGNYVFLNLFLAILMDGFCGALDDNVEEDLDMPEDQLFMLHIEQNLLKTNNDLQRQKKAIEYKLQRQKENQQANNKAGTPNMSLNNSIIDDDVEIDIVNHQVKVHKPLYQGVECEDSLYIFNKRNIIRIICYRSVTHHFFEQVIQAFIIISSIKLALDTYFDPDSDAGLVSADLDYIFNAVFLLEAVMKIVAFGWFLDENSYLTETWSQLDFFIVCCSIVDMSFSGINLPVIKVLRLLRILRPLRFISHNKNLKTIVIALLESLSGMVNVIIVVLLIWLMFGILGISLLGQRMGYCNVDNYYNIRRLECLRMGEEWVIYEPNWDDIYMSMQSLFILTTLEGWPNIMYQAMDSDIPSSGPRYRNYTYISFYFISFILVGSFILINLFTGVICYYFENASKNEKRRGNIILTTEQENWIEIQRMTVDVKVGIVKERPANFIRAKFFDLVESGYFDALIMMCILFNIATMAMVFEESSQQYNSILESINTGFTSVFIAETTFKIIAYGLIDFLQSGWNQFDLFVVVTSLLDISLSQVGTNASFLRVGPQLIRIVRVLRVTRLLKLVKSMRGLQKLLQSLYYSLPALMNIGALLFLCFFIFSILAVFLFKNTPYQDQINVFNNFDNFGLSLMTLYRCSTGENWEWIMYDVYVQQPFAPLFFMCFLLISTWVMLNLFILIIIQYLENYNLKEDNPLDVFGENLEIFREHWSRMTVANKGEKMHQKKILDFFQELPPPIGFGPKIKRQTIAKEIMNMQLIGDGLGNVYFNELLHASIKRAIGMQHFRDAKRDLNLELQIYLGKAETETRRQIEQNKLKEFRRKKYKFLPNPKNPINPLLMYLFNRMCFIAWRNYGILKIQEHEDTPVTEYDSEVDEDDSLSKDSQQEESILVEDIDPKPKQLTKVIKPIERIDEQDDDHSPQKKKTVFNVVDPENPSSKVQKNSNKLLSPSHSVNQNKLIPNPKENDISFSNPDEDKDPKQSYQLVQL